MPTDGEGVSVLPALKFASGCNSEPPRHLHQQRRRRSSAALDEPPAAAAEEPPPLPAALTQVKTLNIEGIERLHRDDTLGASAALDAAWAALEAHVAQSCPPAGDEPAATAAAVRSLQAATLSNRGCVLKRQGRVAEALAAMAEAIALEGAEGPSPSTLTNYAACLTAAGRYKEAVAACRRAVQGMTAQQGGVRRGEADAAGSRHLLVATYHNLAHAQMCVPAEVQFAAGSFAQAYRLAVTFLGPTHPTTLAVAEHKDDAAGRGHAHRHKHHRRHHAAPPHAPRQPRPPAQQARRRSTRTTSVVQEAAAAAAAALAASSSSSLPDITSARNHVAAAAPQPPSPPQQQQPQAPQRDLGGASFRQGGRPMTKKDAAQLQEAKERARRERTAHPRRADLRPLGGGGGKGKKKAAAAAATAEADTQTPPAGPLIMLDHRGSPLCAPEVVASPGFFSSYAAEEAAAAATAVAAPLSPLPQPPQAAAAAASAATGEEEEEEVEEEAPYAADEEAEEEAEEVIVVEEEEEEEAAALCPQPPSRGEEASSGEIRRAVECRSRLDEPVVRGEEQVAPAPAPAPAGSGTLHIPSGVEAAAARAAAEATQAGPPLAPRPPLPAAATTTASIDSAHPQAMLEVVPAESPPAATAATAANVVPRRVETQPRTLAEIRAELAGVKGCGGGGGLAPRKAYSEPSAPHSRASAVGTPTPRCASQASSAAFDSSAAAAAFGGGGCGGVSRRFAAKRQRRLRQMERDTQEEAALQKEGERVQRAASLRAEALERAAERRRARQAVCASTIQRAYRRHLRRRQQRQQRERRTPPPPPPDGVLQAIAATPEAIACGFLDTLLRFKTRAELEVFTRHVVGIQRAWRAVAARLLIAARKAAAARQWAAAVEAERLHHAAAVLQAIARGICARRRVREVRWRAVEKWALTIYAWWLTRRTWVDGRWVSRRCYEGARATEVQRVWRGFAGRRRAADARLRRRMDAVAAPVEWTAALTLQSAVRACLSARVAAVLGCRAAVRAAEVRRRARVGAEERQARGVLEGLQTAGEAQAREDMRINAKLPQARAFAERCRAERLACIEKQWGQRVEEMYTPGPSVRERQRAWVLDTERVDGFVRAARLVQATLRVQRFLRGCLKAMSPAKRVLNERFRQAVRDRRSKRHAEVKELHRFRTAREERRQEELLYGC